MNRADAVVAKLKVFYIIIVVFRLNVVCFSSLGVTILSFCHLILMQKWILLCLCAIVIQPNFWAGLEVWGWAVVEGYPLLFIV